ncbi:sigma 54-interacting transcriptional regulator [Aneurinibacillus sp. Ricciae_BoGa-3]|uniref:sigma-54 interaction domain-containing protein n=1 Tax=Aneurinibacillus sp. Ricciae_BoGa-3 TaxID=3022697 RepID=UPI0023409CEB|nr:sigma 54-interacting transcriptional regulator [Aneurinibacillus sp. Ricciae_BoGa-3]WCK54964.1 sigma 54-interacting transcriptional regulator [Aneurinibacillus sp. Ricciae_BoGa-3]
MSTLSALTSAHFEWLLGIVNVGVHIISSDGTTVFYNKRMAEIDGFEQENVVGRNIFHLFPSLTNESSTLIRVLHSGEEIVDKVQTYVNSKGKQITSINSTYPIKQAGNIMGAVELAEDITRVVHLHDQVLQLRQQLVQKNTRGKKSESTGYQFYDLIGESPLFARAIALAKKAARSASPVLITGATGTGKELIAQSIHNAGIRRNKPFIAQNCAAMPGDLMEGLLFGTTKGAFTGAIDRPGIFEQANGGTLLLDEINSLDLQLQAKLLRVLQDGKIRRIGSMNEQAVDVRILAAMNIPAKDAVSGGIIRSDLFFRLNVVNIELPPLSERQKDIPLLAEHFMNKFNEAFGLQVKGFSDSAMNQLLAYPWPGNIRELSHSIESAFHMLEAGEEWIEPEHLPLSPVILATMHPEKLLDFMPQSSIATPINLTEITEKIEREIIQDALRQCEGNISRTAEFLQVKRQSLQYKLKKYRL